MPVPPKSPASSTTSGVDKPVGDGKAEFEFANSRSLVTVPVARLLLHPPSPATGSLRGRPCRQQRNRVRSNVNRLSLPVSCSRSDAPADDRTAPLGRQD